jgi:hypothetical protein
MRLKKLPNCWDDTSVGRVGVPQGDAELDVLLEEG